MVTSKKTGKGRCGRPLGPAVWLGHVHRRNADLRTVWGTTMEYFVECVAETRCSQEGKPALLAGTGISCSWSLVEALTSGLLQG